MDMVKKLLVALTFFLSGILSAQKKINVELKDPLKPIVSVNVSLSETEPPEALNFERGKKTLAVFMVTHGVVSTIPLIGNYSVQKNKLIFVPQFNLGRNLEFEVQYYENGDTLKKRFTTPKLPEPAIPLSQVNEVFPRTDKIPSNILLFYIEFSKPMTDEILAYKNVKILNDEGTEMEMVWRNKSYWVNGKILVMMVHPGRVKRGLKSFSELEELFTVGKEYTFLVTSGIKDEYERPILKEYRKKFTITDDDREMPKIKFESFTTPVVDSRQPLQIKFSEGMDYVSVLTGLKIFTASGGTLVEGEIKYTDKDSVWNFIPKNNWKIMPYEVHFEKVLSDFAGNHIHRLFEIKDLNDLNEGSMPRKWTFTPAGKK